MTSLRLLYIGLLLAILWLQIQIWMGASSIWGILKVKQQLNTVVAKNETLATKNAKMYLRIDNLKHNNQVVESIARYDLGLMKQGEVYYQLVYRDPVKAEDNGE